MALQLRTERRETTDFVFVVLPVIYAVISRLRPNNEPSYAFAWRMGRFRATRRLSVCKRLANFDDEPAMPEYADLV